MTLPELKVAMNIECPKGYTPFYLAAHYGDEETVKHCIDLGVDINQRNSSGWTPLIAATQEENIEIVKILIDAGADVNLYTKGYNHTALFRAATCANIEIMKLLINAGADVTILDHTGGSPLTSIQFGNNKVKYPYEAVKLLIEAGADINHKGSNGWTCIIYAATWNHYNTVKYLLDNGADVKSTINKRSVVDITDSPQIQFLLQHYLYHKANIRFALTVGSCTNLCADILSVIGAFAGFQSVPGQKAVRDMIMSVQALKIQTPKQYRDAL